jgi:hypothetical protein
MSEPKVKIHAKHLSLMITVGTEDRERSLEQFEQDVREALEAANVKGVTKSNAYYILDGKVCLPESYSTEEQDFLPGATPPAWAGGPAKSPAKVVDLTEAEAPKKPEKKPVVDLDDVMDAVLEAQAEEVTA